MIITSKAKSKHLIPVRLLRFMSWNLRQGQPHLALCLIRRYARSMSAARPRGGCPRTNVIDAAEQAQTNRLFAELLVKMVFEKPRSSCSGLLGKPYWRNTHYCRFVPYAPFIGWRGQPINEKSVAVVASNTTIYSCCTLLLKNVALLIDPVLELSVCDDIPHLLSPVVIDPGRAVVAKWAVQNGNRYRKCPSWVSEIRRL